MQSGKHDIRLEDQDACRNDLRDQFLPGADRVEIILD